jgi:hypothetical protein
MKAISLVQTVIAYKATTTCKVKNMELVIEELESMIGKKGYPQRLIKRAIKIAKKQQSA